MSIRPAEKGEIKFALPQFEEFTLDNGLRVIYARKDNLPIVQTVFCTYAGSKYDPSENHGTAYLTSLLIDEGAGGLSGLEIDNEIERIGSVFNISADNDIIKGSVLTLSEYFDKSVELLSKIIINPHFDESDFNREQDKLINKLSQLKDDAGFLASSVFEKKLFEGSKYGHNIFGDSSKIKNITQDKIKNFHRTNFGFNNSFIIIVGETPKEIIKEVLNKYFGSWNSYAEQETPEIKPTQNKASLYFTSKKDAAQSEIVLGNISTGRKSDDFFAKIILNTILGGQFSSRLNHVLREEKGYTYGINSSFNYLQQIGFFEIGSAVQSEHTFESIEIILNEIKKIKEEITPEEIEFAKSYLTKRYPSLFQTYYQIANSLTNMILYGLEAEYFNNYVDKVNSVTLDDLYSAAEKNILMGYGVISVCGNKESTFEEIKKLPGFEIYETDNEGNVIL